jgi:hypothetical protein
LTKENLIQSREDKHLSLRKEKVDETIMKNRLNSLKKYSKLKINVTSLIVPDILKKNFENSKEKVPIITNLLQQEDINIQKFAIYNLRLLTEGEANFFTKCSYQFITDNLFPHLLNIILLNPDESMKYEASWVLINILSDDDEDSIAKLFLDRNIMTSLENMLCNTKLDTTLTEHILWIIGNILAEDVGSFITDNHFFIHNLEYWSSDNVLKINSFSNSCIYWVIMTYIRKFNSANIALFGNILINTLNALKVTIEYKNKMILSEILEALKEFHEYPIFFDCLLANNIVSTILVCIAEVDMYRELKLCIQILSLLLGSNNESHIHEIMQYPVLNKLIEIIDKASNNINIPKLESEIREIIRNTCLCISNILGSNDEKYILEILSREDLFEDLIYILNNTYDNGIIYEVLFIFQNLFYSGNNSVKSEYIKRNYHKLFWKVVKMDDLSNKVKLLILEVIYQHLSFSEKISNKTNIIKYEMDREGIWDIIERIIYDPDSNIYEAAHKIYDNFFNEEKFYNSPSDLY